MHEYAEAQAETPVLNLYYYPRPICRGTSRAEQNILKEFKGRPRRYEVFKFIVVVQIISNVYRILEA